MRSTVGRTERVRSDAHGEWLSTFVAKAIARIELTADLTLVKSPPAE